MDGKKSRELAGKARSHGRPGKSHGDPQLEPLRHDHELEYEIRTQQKVLLAKKVEAALVRRYCDWLQDRGRKLVKVKYENLQCDAYEKERGNLIEAKCSANREYIRMAVGQLLDYSHLGRKRFGKPNMAILLPKRPTSKSVEWLSELHISVFCEEKDEFLATANRRFI